MSFEKGYRAHPDHQHQLHANSDHCRLTKIHNFGRLDQGIFGRIL